MQLSKLYHNPKFKLQTLYAFSLIGLIIAAYLWYLYSQPQQIGCTLGGGCEVVRQTVYSEFLGISVPVWGIVYYLAVSVYAVTRLVARRVFKYENLGLLVFVTGGFLFSVYLTYLELFVIHAVCVYCVASALTATALLLNAMWISEKELGILKGMRVRRK
jgi:uncharacterized membrane protein